MAHIADFTQEYLNFDPVIEDRPIDMAWCGNDAVVLYFESVVMLVGSYGDWLTFSTSEPVVLTPEIDGIRIISTSKHYLMRRVPMAMVDVMSPTSEHVGRQLYLARIAFDNQDARADKMLRNIKDELADGISACIEVSGDFLFSRKHPYSLFSPPSISQHTIVNLEIHSIVATTIKYHCLVCLCFISSMT